MVERNNVRIKDLQTENRPRERLSRLGAGVLSDGELLAILLSSGTSEKSSIELGNEILKELGGLNGLARADISSLMSIKGVGEAKAAQLMAAMELAIRLKRADIQPRKTVLSPQDVAEMLLPGLSKESQEVFWVVYLNRRNQMLHMEELFRGAQDRSTINIGEIFTQAVRRKAISIIVAHNHPSGDPSESPEDVNLTRAVIEAGRILDIDVLDHLVIGQKTYTSIRREHPSLWLN